MSIKYIPGTTQHPTQADADRDSIISNTKRCPTCGQELEDGDLYLSAEQLREVQDARNKSMSRTAEMLRGMIK